MNDIDLDTVIGAALREDMPEGDITSENIIPQEAVSNAVLVAKEKGILAGIDVAEKVFKKIDNSVIFKKLRDDGQSIEKGNELASIKGNSISLLKGERTALNFLQRMSGIATETSAFVRAVQGTKTQVLDTRKTTPGLRLIEKYAVKAGGGQNHRFSLSDMVMIKDNHLKIVGSISDAIKMAHEKIKPEIQVEVETSSLEEVREAVESGADIIMLDNMTLEEIKEVVEWNKGRVPLEVSGNVSLETAREIAMMGVDYISVGSLTHSFKSLDISMEFLD
jgi:nicotinate-nucleotide pyrophosphorylase (carboxylating)